MYVMCTLQQGDLNQGMIYMITFKMTDRILV